MMSSAIAAHDLDRYREAESGHRRIVGNGGRHADHRA